MLKGIWDHSEGKLLLPNDRSIYFLPQDAVLLPNLPLLDQLSFPEDWDSSLMGSEDVASIFSAANISYLVKRAESCGDDQDWRKQLSAGETQKVMLARVLFHVQHSRGAIRYVVLDECTSNVDEGTEESFYRKLFEVGGDNLGVLSVGHRWSLRRFHAAVLTVGA